MAAPSNEECIDIVLLSYNGRQFLKEQIESILSQTYSKFTLFLCDDGSTDNSPEILQEYEGQENVRVFLFKENLGINKHLQRALRLTEAEWLAISDQDDIWAPNKLELLMSERQNSSLVFANSQIIDGKGELTGEVIVPQVNFEIGQCWQKLFLQNIVSGHAAIFSREVLDALGELREYAIYDHQLAIAAAMLSGIHYVPHSLVSHRRHDSNSWHTQNHNLDSNGRHNKRIIWAKQFIDLWSVVDDLSEKQKGVLCVPVPFKKFVNAEKYGRPSGADFLAFFLILLRDKRIYNYVNPMSVSGMYKKVRCVYSLLRQ